MGYTVAALSIALMCTCVLYWLKSIEVIDISIFCIVSMLIAHPLYASLKTPIVVF
jgi:hypothetical protein